MPTLEQIVNLNISLSTPTLTRQGFGTPLLLAQNLPVGFGTNLVKSYSSTAEMTADGFVPTHPAYLAGAALFGQDKHCRTLKVGKKTTIAQSFTLTVTLAAATEGNVITLNVNGTPITYTVPASSTPTSVATALELLIDAVSGVASSSAAAVITVGPAVAGEMVRVKGWRRDYLEFDCAGSSGSIAADLAAIAVEDNDWYGLLVDSVGAAEIDACAVYALANEKVMFLRSCDFNIPNGVIITDIFSDLQIANNNRSVPLFAATDNLDFRDAAWMGQMFSFLPGQATAAYKQLKGIVSDKLSSSEMNAVNNKNGSTHTALAGTGFTFEGKTSDGEFFDVIHGLDELKAEMKIRVLALILANPKIAYTDTGIEQIRVEIESVMRERATDARPFLDPASIVVTAPLVSEIAAITRQSRVVPDFNFSARLAGAIHRVDPINGTLGA